MSMPKDFQHSPKGADPLQAARQVDLLEDDEGDTPVSDSETSKDKIDELVSRLEKPIQELKKGTTMSMPTDFRKSPKEANPFEAILPHIDSTADDRRDGPMNESHTSGYNSDELVTDLDKAVRKNENPSMDRNTPMTTQVQKVFKEHYSALKSRRAEVLKERERLNNRIRQIDAQAFEIETIIDILGGAK